MNSILKIGLKTIQNGSIPEPFWFQIISLKSTQF